MTVAQREKYLKLLLKKNFEKYTRAIQKKIMEALETETDMGKIQKILNEMFGAVSKITTQMFILKLGITEAQFLTMPNYRPLLEMLKERQAIFARHMKNYRFVIQKEIFTAKELMNKILQIRIGRRGQDIVRGEAMKLISKNYLTGQQTSKTIPELRQVLTEYSKKLKLGTRDGQPVFPLEIWPYNGKTHYYRVDSYAELVGISTVGEATQAGLVSQAMEAGTRFVKYNRTAKVDPKDYVCKEINGQPYSAIPETTNETGKRGAYGKSGRFYEYFQDVLDRFRKRPFPKYNTAHVNCRHIARPYSEALA